MSHVQTIPTNTWQADCDWLRCVDCGGGLEPAGEEALACRECRRAYPIRDGVLDVLRPLDGNNKVAADFYNGPLWPKFRFWEYFAFAFHGGSKRARHQVLKHLPDLSGTRLLEVAIGDGTNVPYFPPDCQIYGNDISTVQLEGCRRKFTDRGLHLVLGEATDLPFQDQTFDNVLSFGAFNYFNDPLGALREMARVCKPGGRVVVSDEVPSLPNRMIGHWIGLPKLDRWILARGMNLGPEFTDMVERHRDLKLEPIVREVLDDWTIHSLWLTLGYCIVGRPKG